MKYPDSATRKRDLLLKPLLSILLLAGLTIGTFLVSYQKWMSDLTQKVEMQHRQNIMQIVMVARNTVEPVMVRFRSGGIGRAEAIKEIRSLLRRMTYRDEYGNNYVFMSSYNGKMLVQPYEPQKEMTSQWDLRDIHGLYIIRELVRAAKTSPGGSFVKYYYFLPGVHSAQEKLAYVVGLPELECYIGTGMYMQMAILEQSEILKRVKYGALWLFIVLLIPLSVSILFILNRNRLLLAEISSREKAEDELKMSEEKYRSIFENVPQGLYQTAPDGRFLSANVTMARMYGYETPEDMIKNTYNVGEQFYADPGRRGLFLKTMKEYGRVEKFITRFRRRNGTFFWGSNNSRAVKDSNGGILYYEGSIEDITTLVEAEARARQSEEKFSKVFMTSPEGIAITRLADGKLLDVNPGFEKITGWGRDEIVGRTSLGIGFWDDPDTRQVMLDDLQSVGIILYRDFRFRCKDRTLRSGVYSAKTITIADEECLVFAMQDLTDRKHMEEEQRRLEQQLFQSQKMDAIGKLAGGVAHDFNNILTGIQGLVSLMLINKSHDETSENRLLRIEEQVKRGADLTRRLLDLARESVHEKKPVSIHELISRSTQLFTETTKGIEFNLNMQSGLFHVEADSGQIEQVLLNLFINADHAMPDGGTITVQTTNMALQEQDARIFEISPGDYIRISIADTGTGIDSETLKRIFEPFFTTKADRGGTGLGLASAYGIIRNHGGIINAYSEPGYGTTFNIYLPLSAKDVEGAAELQGKELFYGEGNILIIDDEKPILEAASEMLNILGYSVLQALNGQEGIDIYNEKGDSIDLVILDMIMPGISGSQVLKNLREINPGVKVIISSGHIMQGESLKVKEYEFNSFMQKPYSIIDLSRIVYEALKEPSL